MSKLKITPVEVEFKKIDPPASVYHLLVENEDAMWTESFNTPGELRACLQGMKIRNSMSGDMPDTDFLGIEKMSDQEFLARQKS